MTSTLIVSLSFKVSLHFAFRNSFACSPRRIVIFQIHRLLLRWRFLWWTCPCWSAFHRRPFWWRRCSTLHTLWCRFEKLTLRRGPASDRSWLTLDKRSFSVHFCFTLQRQTCFAFFWREREKACGFTNAHSESVKTASQTTSTFTSEKRAVTTSTHTQRRTQEFPLLSTSESGQRTSKTLLDTRSKQILLVSTLSLSPSTSLFPFFFPLLWLPCSRSPFLLLFLPHPPAANCRESFLQGAHLRLFWANILCLPTFSSWQGSTALFLSHETTHLKLFPKPIAFLPVDPSFPCHVQTLFYKDKIESVEWQDLAPRQRTGDCL